MLRSSLRRHISPIQTLEVPELLYVPEAHEISEAPEAHEAVGAPQAQEVPEAIQAQEAPGGLDEARQTYHYFLFIRTILPDMF